MSETVQRGASISPRVYIYIYISIIRVFQRCFMSWHPLSGRRQLIDLLIIHGWAEVHFKCVLKETYMLQEGIYNESFIYL